ncbi:glycosyltransferase [Polynucleobacter sphagniphilus]|uniref:glycosyltransferase n=1 Tax=Polynucleobacter sphagniphilus TaxID=1743169 RepID=UPI002473CB80|nr:glycosyltransferase [Polynucleobacter sphagniphilus]
MGKYWRKNGGIETHVRTLCKGLASQNIDIVNLVSSIDSTSSDFQIDAYRVVEAPTFGVYFSTSITPALVLKARQLHKEKPFDLIHFHFPDPMSHLASLVLPRSIPRIMGWHSDIIRQKKLLTLYRPWQYQEIMKSSAIVGATSAHLLHSLQIPKNYPESQKYVIPYGMSYDRFNLTPEISKSSENIKHEISKGRFTVFALGRHVEYKGFGVLLDAIKITNAQLILGGDGPLTSNLKEKANHLKISDRVHFAGRLTEEELPAYYHACDVFCLPSITPNEAFGLVQLEAMACSKPIICTQLHNGVNVANPHMQTGLTVEAKNPGELAIAIEKLQYDLILRERLGRQAFEHARNTYSIDAMSTAYLDLYTKILTTNK